MFAVNSFFDYCISEKCFNGNNEAYDKTIRLLYDYGYRTIAINQDVSEDNIETKKKKKKGEARDNFDCVPPPHKIHAVQGCEKLKVLNRLTINFSNQDALQKITKSQNYKKYDIIAVLPTSLPAFMFTASTLEADIICFDPLNKHNIRINSRTYNQLIGRGYHFEIQYGQAIEDATKRRHIIHMSHLFHAFGKSRNIILSSGATNHMLIRGPYDVINLGFIFGLSELQARNSITHYGKQVFVNSVGRRHGKSVMFVENINEESKDKSIISIGDSEDEDMEIDQPVYKKSKQ